MRVSLPRPFRVALLVVTVFGLLAARQAVWAAPWKAPLNQTVPTRTKVYTPTQVQPSATARPATATTQPNAGSTPAAPTQAAPTHPAPTSASPASATNAPSQAPAATATPKGPYLPPSGGTTDALWLAGAALIGAAALIRIALVVRSRRGSDRR